MKSLVWWRCIDDIFMMWEHREEQTLLEAFLETLNCYHATITFIAQYSREKNIFLDITVMKTGNRSVTDLYVKAIDTHQYLHVISCHVCHCKKSITFSQVLGLNRIYSENAFF